MKKFLFLVLVILGVAMIFSPKFFNYDPIMKHYDFRTKIFPGCNPVTEGGSEYSNEIVLTPTTLNATCEGAYSPMVYDETGVGGWTSTGDIWWGLEAWDEFYYDTEPAFFIPQAYASGLETTLYRNIDLVNEGATTGQIDGGSAFQLNYKQASLDPLWGNPYGKVILQALNSSMNVLDSIESDYIEVTPYETWKSYSLTLDLPVGTRFVRITFWTQTDLVENTSVCMFDTLQTKFLYN
jgi:hypothetical protein